MVLVSLLNLQIKFRPYMVRMYYTCLYQKMVTIWYYYFTYQSITTMKLWITYLLSHDIQVSSWNICLHFKLITDLYFKLKVMVCGSFLCCFVVILFNVITKKMFFRRPRKLSPAPNLQAFQQAHSNPQSPDYIMMTTRDRRCQITSSTSWEPIKSNLQASRHSWN